MKLLTEVHFLVPTLLLFVASVLDVRYGKFPNWLFIASLCLGAIWLGIQADIGEVMKGLGAAALIFIILIPLVLFKALGAGDIKLMAAFCLLTSFSTASYVFLYSLFWGLLFGLLKMTLSGDLKNFLQSFVLKNPQVKSHKIPYTVAILFGWFSFVTLGGLT